MRVKGIETVLINLSKAYLSGEKKVFITITLLTISRDRISYEEIPKIMKNKLTPVLKYKTSSQLIDP